jgi:hypothetical protein
VYPSAVVFGIPSLWLAADAVGGVSAVDSVSDSVSGALPFLKIQNINPASMIKKQAPTDINFFMAIPSDCN